MMVVNGATIRFRNKCRIELVSQARFLFGKQIMGPQDADSALGRLYLEMQAAYVGPIEDQPAALERARALLADLTDEAGPAAAAALSPIVTLLEDGDFYRALKIVRRMISSPDDTLRREAP